MKGPLYASDASESPVSPLVDVVFNAMAAIFVILIIYIAVARPNEQRPLQLLTDVLPAATWYQVFEAGLAAEGGVPPYRFSVSGEIPKWLTLNPANGHFAGNPRPLTDDAGNNLQSVADAHEVTLDFSVEDASANRVQKSLQLKIHPSAYPFDHEEHPLRFGIDTLPRAYVGRPYTAFVAPQGGIEPYELVTSNDLPPGIEIRDQALSGLPQQAGKFWITLELRDQQRQHGFGSGSFVSTRRTFDLEVYGDAPPAISVATPMGRVDEPYQAIIAPELGAPPFTWRLEGTVPPGLRAVATELRSVSDTDGKATDVAHEGGSVLQISGTPEQAGAFVLQAHLTDDQARERSYDLTLDILPALDTLNIIGSFSDARVGVRYAGGLTTVGAVPPVVWAVEGEDIPGLTISQGSIQGVPMRTMRTVLNFAVTAALQRNAKRSVTLTVRPPISTLQLRRVTPQ